MSDFRQKLGVDRWSGPLITSLLAISIAVIVIITNIPTLLGALSTPSSDGRNEDIFATLTEAHNQQAEVSSRRFLGRSPFVVPGRPSTRPAPAPVRTERPKPEPRPIPKVDTGPPSSYTGPAPTGVAGTVVFFGSNVQVSVGREENGVKVLGILGPTLVRLGHKGGEYDVSFLDDDYSSIFKPFAGSTSSDVLGSAPENIQGAPSTVVAAEPTERTVAQSSLPVASEPWAPRRGGAVTVTFNDGGQERTITGRIQYMASPNGDGGGSMVIRGEIDGRTVFQRIDDSQVVEMIEAPEDSLPPLDAGDEADPEEESETAEEEMGEEDPVVDPQLEERLRGMSVTQLESRHYQLTAVLNRPELQDQMRAGVEAELRLINDLLRERANDG
ncbi:MAG: hypothetical protein GY895_04800 [Phycisphaera sp.]|nr:hypothetical protein [Phycisphaera sp.]